MADNCHLYPSPLGAVLEGYSAKPRKTLLVPVYPFVPAYEHTYGLDPAYIYIFTGYKGYKGTNRSRARVSLYPPCVGMGTDGYRPRAGGAA